MTRAWISLGMLLVVLAAGVGRAREIEPSDWRMAELGSWRGVVVTPDGRTVIVRSETQVLRSTDGAKTFAEILAGTGEVTALTLDRQGRVWVLRDRKLGRLDSSGETWQPIAGPEFVDRVVVDADVVVIGGGDRFGLYRLFVSKDGGKSFTQRGDWRVQETLELVVRDGVISYVTGPADVDDGYQTLFRGNVDLEQLAVKRLENGTPVHDGAIDVGGCGASVEKTTMCFVSDKPVMLEGVPAKLSRKVWLATAEAGARRFVKVGSKFYEVVGSKLVRVAERRIETEYTFSFAAAEDGTLWVVDTGMLYRFTKGWKRVEPSSN